MKRVQLIPEWRQGWRFLSVQFNMAAVLWMTLPEHQQHSLVRVLWKDASAMEVAGLLVVCGIVCRFILQPKLRRTAKEMEQ
jgi:hypothetical protein